MWLPVCCACRKNCLIEICKLLITAKKELEVTKMYISKICNENIGPLEKIKILPELTEKGNPKPILFVGENGSGKSTLISNIVAHHQNVWNKKLV